MTRHLFIPTVYSAHGGSLPRTDPRMRADFLAQHAKHGWREADAMARYELWVDGAIDTNPDLAAPGYDTVASAVIARARLGDVAVEQGSDSGRERVAALRHEEEACLARVASVQRKLDAGSQAVTAALLAECQSALAAVQRKLREAGMRPNAG